MRRPADDGMPLRRVEAQRNADGTESPVVDLPESLEDQRSRWLDPAGNGAGPEE